jgi:EAL domain-containing protein (putative c-di-GMP-specific phosphodiesterase class I)
MLATPAQVASSNSVKTWYLQEVRQDGEQTQHISIPVGRFQIGRRTDIGLCLPFANVSKLHAEIVATDDSLFIRDLGSTNGTFVNGLRVKNDTPIGPSDVLHFADREFIIGCTHFDQARRTMVCDAVEDWQSSFLKFHRLLTDRGIIPHFQSIVRLADHSVVGYEALARGTEPGLKSPAELFSTAERISLAARLSELCRDRAIESAMLLKQPGLIFLNTHPSESLEVGLIQSLSSLRKKAPDLKLVIELHESAITNVREVAEFRKQLNELGIGLAYDDFGAGQARLKELSEVAPDYLKFDIQLVRDIHLVPQRQQIVAGLVQTIQSLGINSVAEGIESAAEAEVCRQIGFTHAQGFFYSNPVPCTAIES